MNQTIPIFCINLARAEKRRERIRVEWCQRYGFDIQFFEAFDRRNLPKNPILIPNQIKLLQFERRKLTDGEVACATSHYLLCKKILDEGYSEAIIMEDDIYPIQRGFSNAEQFYERINTAKNSFPGLKALILHDHKNDRDRRKIKRRFSKIERLLQNILRDFLGRNHKKKFAQQIIASAGGCHLLATHPWGCRMVWYNRTGLELMIEHLAQMYVPADHIYKIAFTPDQAVAVLDPPLAGHYGDDTFIENERFGTERRKYQR